VKEHFDQNRVLLILKECVQLTSWFVPETDGNERYTAKFIHPETHEEFPTRYLVQTQEMLKDVKARGVVKVEDHETNRPFVVARGKVWYTSKEAAKNAAFLMFIESIEAPHL